MAETSSLVYKGHPLMRKDDFIYLGSTVDKYFVTFRVLESKNFLDLNLATRVLVQLELTDQSVKAKDRVLKKSEKEDFYTAFDLGAVWLERALASK